MEASGGSSQGVASPPDVRRLLRLAPEENCRRNDSWSYRGGYSIKANSHWGGSDTENCVGFFRFFFDLCRFRLVWTGPKCVCTLPDTETDTDTDKKWVVKNCMEVFILHRCRHRQITIVPNWTNSCLCLSRCRCRCRAVWMHHKRVDTLAWIVGVWNK